MKILVYHIDISHGGYAALASVLLISAITLVVVTSYAMMSISSAQTTIDDTKQVKSFTLTESCAEDVLRQITKSDSVPSTVVFPEGSCTISINSHIGNVWVFTVLGSKDGYTKQIQVSATRGAKLSINSWVEL